MAGTPRERVLVAVRPAGLQAGRLDLVVSGRAVLSGDPVQAGRVGAVAHLALRDRRDHLAVPVVGAGHPGEPGDHGVVLGRRDQFQLDGCDGAGVPGAQAVQDDGATRAAERNGEPGGPSGRLGKRSGNSACRLRAPRQ
ncbi:hypothetical protein GCM10010254_67000 [Streptomyces chromofuscus]|nr:hypothetical protein GCM10010254_67000 [Streptomyces chromofuscus]